MKTILCGLFSAGFFFWASIMYVRCVAEGKALPHVRVNAWDIWQLLVIALAIFLFGLWVLWLTVTESKHRIEEADEFLRCIASLIAIWITPVLLTILVRTLIPHE